MLWMVALSSCHQSNSQVREDSIGQSTQIDQNLSKETTNTHRKQKRDSLRCEIIPEERTLSFEEFCIRQQIKKQLFSKTFPK